MLETSNFLIGLISKIRLKSQFIYVKKRIEKKCFLPQQILPMGSSFARDIIFFLILNRIFWLSYINTIVNINKYIFFKCMRNYTKLLV